MTHTVDVEFLADAEWFVGEDKSLSILIKKPDDTPEDITGWTFAWELRLSRYHPAVLLSKSSASGITFSSPTAGGPVIVAIAKDDTKALKAGTYYHGLARTNASSWDVVAEGRAVLRKAGVHAT